MRIPVKEINKFQKQFFDSLFLLPKLKPVQQIAGEEGKEVKHLYLKDKEA